MALAACGPRTTAPPDLTVVYEKTGGFMPFNDRLVVRGDGSLTYTDRTKATRTANVGPAELEKLRSLLSSREFQGAAPEYRASGGADLVSHRVEATVAGRTKTVTTMTGVQAPPVVDQVIAELER